jgi:hypothetical protein
MPWIDPLGGGTGRHFIGIYHHPYVGPLGITSSPVKDTFANESIAFASSYAAKSALWLLRFP